MVLAACVAAVPPGQRQRHPMASAAIAPPRPMEPTPLAQMGLAEPEPLDRMGQRLLRLTVLEGIARRDLMALPELLLMDLAELAPCIQMDQ